MVIRKECFKDVGYFNENLQSSEDYNLSLRMAYVYPLVYLNRISIKYRVRNDSISGLKEMRHYYYKKWDGDMFENYSANCPPEYKNFIRKKACDCYKIAIWGYLRQGDMNNVRSLCYKFLRLNKNCLKIYIYVLISWLPIRFLHFETEKAKVKFSM